MKIVPGPYYNKFGASTKCLTFVSSSSRHPVYDARIVATMLRAVTARTITSCRTLAEKACPFQQFLYKRSGSSVALFRLRMLTVIRPAMWAPHECFCMTHAARVVDAHFYRASGAQIAILCSHFSKLTWSSVCKYISDVSICLTILRTVCYTEAVR